MHLLHHLVAALAVAAAPVHSLPAAAPVALAARSGSIDINSILALIADLLPFNKTVAAVAGAIASVEQAVASALAIPVTENGLSSGSCADIIVIFARGTFESGNVGVFVGPELLAALKSATKASVSMQGVAYPADVDGFFAGGDDGGSLNMANDVKLALSSCPNTKVVMSGYSQGGQLVHKAASILGAGGGMARVSSVVIFGDPDNGTALAGIDPSKVLVICHERDDICEGGDIILLSHVTYAADVGTAAAFIVAAAGL